MANHLEINLVYIRIWLADLVPHTIGLATHQTGSIKTQGWIAKWWTNCCLVCMLLNPIHFVAATLNNLKQTKSRSQGGRRQQVFSIWLFCCTLWEIALWLASNEWILDELTLLYIFQTLQHSYIYNCITTARTRPAIQRPNSGNVYYLDSRANFLSRWKALCLIHSRSYGR